ncbi:MerR family transcriptional regulator [Clostridium sp. P21]|uniref:MerR family transcriptional regulator n=1 Tax=Clostridium muellerianum TaxID=2716538 RepID=A0A7Y0EGZ7_9CLOT|nr:MerR family transcriptional regulator [Clostridium muellerianum]NMM63263.1 MerR family transcriptional regulator [Clostridium muellerianum]
MNTYRTAEVAKIIGIHPNTVRLYEELSLIPKPRRQSNGYRVFTDLHIEQFKLARIAFKIEVLQNGLRKKVVEIVKLSAAGNFKKAISLTQDYVEQIQKEQSNAEEAIESVKQLLSNETTDTLSFKRKEAAEYLQVSMDALRNWEMNGLLSVKRKQNGYRVYRDEDIRRLKIIRSLRCANYSLEAILRMIEALSKNPNVNIKKVLDTPSENDEIISVCDKLITSLKWAEKNAHVMLFHIKKMKRQFS